MTISIASGFHFPCPPQQSGSGSGKSVKCRARGLIKKRDPAQMPISWRGTLAQYAGRLRRLHPAKRQVVIFGYVDGREPVFAKMAAKREAGYASLGYEIADREDALAGMFLSQNMNA